MWKKRFLNIVVVGLSMIVGTAVFGQTPNILTDEYGMQYIPGELIVKFKADEINLQQSRGMRALSQMEDSKDFSTESILPRENIALISLDEGQTLQNEITRLSQDPNVEYVQPNYVYQTLVNTPNDTYFGRQRSLNNTGQTVDGQAGLADADIDRLEAMQIRSGDGNPLTTGTTVAVLDVGIDYDHQDLTNQMRDGTNCLTSTGASWGGCGGGGFDAYHGTQIALKGYHGTHVAGIIGAETNNGLGVAGVNPHAKLMNINIGINGGVNSYYAIAALSFAKYNGARIVNMSRGGRCTNCTRNPDPSLYAAIRDFPGLVTIAAGNRSTEHTGNYFVSPADFAVTTPYWTGLDNVISVGGTDQLDNINVRSPGTSQPGSDYGTRISIGAPSCVYSTVPTNDTTSSCGTSMAAPHVAGTLSLMRSMRPELSYSQIKNIILNQADTIAALSGKFLNGKRLNIFNALEYLYVKQISGLTLYDNNNKENIITSGSYLSGTAGYIERGLSVISGQVTEYIVTLDYSGTIIETTGTTLTGLTMSLSGDGAYEATITPITDDKGLTGETQILNFLVDSTIPTASVVYSPASGSITSGDVLAILTGWNEDLYNISETGYIFTGNGSHTFTFQDMSNKTGSVTATVDRINKPSIFSFTAQTNKELSTPYISNDITVGGIITGTQVSIIGGGYSINSGVFTSGTGIVYSGDRIKIQLTSSSAYSSTTTAILNIDGLTGAFSITTKSAPVSPGGGGGGGGTSTPTCTATDLMCSLSIYVTKPGISCLGGNLGMNCATTGTVVQTGNTSGNISYQTLSPTLSPLFSPELNQAYIYAREIGITTVPSIERANLTGTLIRQHLAKMISNFSINVLEKRPNTGMNCTFEDMHDATSEMKFYAKLACQLGLMGLANDGTPNDNFYPEVEVTRAQFGTVLSRALRGNKYNDSDAENYFTEHLAALKDAGIMKKINDPFNLELRGYVMLMMMRTNEKIK